MTIRAILRVAKLKGAGKAAASGEHLARLRATPNADPSRRHLNERLAGSGDLWADIQERLDTLPTAPRRDAVHAVELLLSASPAYFADGDHARLQAWKTASLAWARDHFGAANVVAAVLHRDEETPHLHVVAVPIVEKTVADRAAPEPRLCARDYTGGRYRLSRLQDSYHAAVEHLGIERGVRGARIEYEHLHQRYTAMTQEPPAVARITEALHVEAPGRFANREEWATREQARLQAELAPLITALAARNGELERRLEHEQRRTEALQHEVRDYRVQAARAQSLDLKSMVRSLGGVQDRHDPHLWRVGTDTISIDGWRYRNLTQHQDGAGAINLLMHLTGCDLNRALDYMAYRGGVQAATVAAADHAARVAERLAERARDMPVDLRLLRPGRGGEDRDDRGR
jgi:hypothetical protein